MNKIQCEACGSQDIQKLDDNFFQCSHCGVKYTVGQIQNMVVKIAGVQDKEELLKNANIFMELKEYNKAIEILWGITEKYPDEYRAWYELLKHSINIHGLLENTYYERTLKFAPENKKIEIDSFVDEFKRKEELRKLQEQQQKEEKRLQKIQRRQEQKLIELQGLKQKRETLHSQIQEEENNLKPIKNLTLFIILACAITIILGYLIFSFSYVLDDSSYIFAIILAIILALSSMFVIATFIVLVFRMADNRVRRSIIVNYLYEITVLENKIKEMET